MLTAEIGHRTSDHRPRRPPGGGPGARAFLLTPLLLLLLAVAGAAYQLVATVLDGLRYPPPGDLVDVGGHRLHLSCSGAGRPTVVLEAGVGDGLLTWALVHADIARVTRVCSYDRAGYGWSDPGPGPRTSERLVEELRTLLGAAGEPAPYVLVGHSFGGVNARLFTARHATAVAGLVLIDSAHEDQLERLPQPPAAMAWIYRAMAVTAPLGLPRLLMPLLFGESQPNLPRDVRRMRRALAARPDAIRAAGDEFAAWAESMEQARSAARPLGGLPLIVLSAGMIEPWPGVSEEDHEEMSRIWNELQDELAERARNGRHVIAERSGHYIQLDQPDLVIEAVTELVEAARRRGVVVRSTGSDPAS